MKSIFTAFWQICLFRNGPELLPANTTFLGAVLVTNIALSLFVLVVLNDVALLQALTAIILNITAFSVLVWAIMSLMQMSARYLQTMTAIFGVDLIISFISNIAAWLMRDSLPAGGAADAAAVEAVVPSWQFFIIVLMVLWNISVNGFVMHRALEVHIGVRHSDRPLCAYLRVRYRGIGSRHMTEHIHFLGIGGTLMGSLAQLAKEHGLKVTGSDQAVYPPMSEQLAAADIEVYEGFDPSQLDPAPDLVVIGNAGLPRGHPAVEYVLESGIPYTSGAQWLGDTVLKGRWVIAIAGTHGKTTTASMVAWILEHAGLNPGYLIGGVLQNLPRSARLGDTPFFVVEADEYDTSYFDRRSKFVHYRPRTLVLNNLEFDHADIFADIGAIQTQFHNLLRTVPGGGLVLAPSNDEHIDELLQRGCWSQLARVGSETARKATPADIEERWYAQNQSPDGSEFDVLCNEDALGRVSWSLLGKHNQHNALNAIAAARHAGVPPATAIEALNRF